MKNSENIGNINWKSMEDVFKIFDEYILAYITKNAEDLDDLDIRKMAVRMISDESILADIAKNEIYPIVLWIAVHKISDESILVDLAKNTKNRNVCRMAVSKISDESILADIAKNTKDRLNADMAVSKIFDESILADIAKNYEEDQFIRHIVVCRAAVVSKISDESILADIAKDLAKNHEKSQIIRDKVFCRAAVVSKISDESILADIAKSEEESRSIHEMAVGKISDESILADIAKIADFDIREMAVGKISDVSILVYIAKNNEDPIVRWKAFDKISDESILEDIAKNTKDPYIREMAVGKISDESILVDIVKNDEDPIVRWKAFDKISDESILEDIVKNDEDPIVRWKAFDKISDESVLADIYGKNTESLDVHNMGEDKVFDEVTTVVDVVMPNYAGIENIGNSYGISAFNEIIPTHSKCSSLSEAIQEILTNEHPVHITHLSKLLLTYLNQNIVTDEIKNQIISEIRENELGNIHGDFTYLNMLSMPVNVDLSITPRIPNIRPINQISTNELMEGMFIIVDKSFTHTKKSLFNETGKLFGFKNPNDEVSKYLDGAFKELLNTDRIILENEIVKTNSFKSYKENINELKIVYENKEKNIRSMIENYFSPEEKLYDRFVGEFNRLNEAILKEINLSLNFINMATEHTKNVVDEIEERINIIKSLIGKMNDFTVELETFEKYEKIIRDLKLKYQEKEGIAKKIIKEHFPPPQITYDRFINEIDNCNEIFYNQINSTSNIIDMVPGLTNKALNNLKEKVKTLTSLKEEIENLVVELTINSTNSSYISNDEVKNLIADMQRLNSSVKEYK